MATSPTVPALGSLQSRPPVSTQPSSLLCPCRCSRHSNYTAFIFNLFLEITICWELVQDDVEEQPGVSSPPGAYLRAVGNRSTPVLLPPRDLRSKIPQSQRRIARHPPAEMAFG
ncbi:hypothetical protein KM043_016046 [Ampulex compressa]|nr:hypothetical protein KM043_016046 [Ampulex compressa]